MLPLGIMTWMSHNYYLAALNSIVFVKKYFVFYLIVSLSLMSCSSKSSVSEPKEIGAKTVEFLREMDGLILEDFSDYFMTVEEMHEMARNEHLDLDNELRQELKKTTESQLSLRQMFLFNRLKRRGRKLKINWKNIELSNFDFAKDDRNGGSFCSGNLIFSEGKRKFRIKTQSIYNGDAYYLIGLHGLMVMEPEG